VCCALFFVASASGHASFFLIWFFKGKKAVMPLAFGGRFYFVRLQRAWPPDTQKKVLARGYGHFIPAGGRCGRALLFVRPSPQWRSPAPPHTPLGGGCLRTCRLTHV
jgi:hypothetical protein